MYSVPTIKTFTRCLAHLEDHSASNSSKWAAISWFLSALNEVTIVPKPKTQWSTAILNRLTHQVAFGKLETPDYDLMYELVEVLTKKELG